MEFIVVNILVVGGLLISALIYLHMISYYAMSTRHSRCVRETLRDTLPPAEYAFIYVLLKGYRTQNDLKVNQITYVIRGKSIYIESPVHNYYVYKVEYSVSDNTYILSDGQGMVLRKGIYKDDIKDQLEQLR
jgi:hypothetical protein